MISPISNSEFRIFLANICYAFFFNWQTEKKKNQYGFGTNKKFVFCFLKVRKICGKKIVKISDDIVKTMKFGRFSVDTIYVKI